MEKREKIPAIRSAQEREAVPSCERKSRRKKGKEKRGAAAGGGARFPASRDSVLTTAELQPLGATSAQSPSGSKVSTRQRPCRYVKEGR